MTSSKQNPVELAKQGNIEAITALMNRHLHPKGITAKAALEDGSLKVMLEASEVPDQEVLVEFVHRGIAGLKSNVIRHLAIYGKQIGMSVPDWSTTFDLHQPLPVQVQTQEKIIPSSEQVTKDRLTEKSPEPIQKHEANRQKKKLAWFETELPILIVALLIIFFPLGLWSMWKYAKWSIKNKAIITAVFAVLLLAHMGRQTPSKSTVGASSTEKTQPKSETKTVVLSDSFQTPVGSFPVVQYAGDSCLYARATTAQTSYYGMSELKNMLKQQYNVTCVLWSD